MGEQTEITFNHDTFPVALRSEYSILTKNAIYGGEDYNRPCSDENCSLCTTLSNTEKDNNCIQVVEPETCAGLKLFALILLRLWRKTSRNLKEVQATIDIMKRNAMRGANQLEIYNQLIRVEQKRNDDLSLQLRKTLRNYKDVKATSDTMSVSLLNMQTDKSILEQELKIKQDEYDTLHTSLSQTKSDLFHCLLDQRKLQSQLSKEQRLVQLLENQKNQLINEICEINTSVRNLEEKYENNLHTKVKEAQQMQDELKTLQTTLKEMEKSNEYIQNVIGRREIVRNESESLRHQIQRLEKQLSNTFDNRISSIWSQFINCQKYTWHILHIFAHCLLPAMPPPTKVLQVKIVPMA